MYNDNAYRIAYTAMEEIDGDLIEEYVDRIHEADEAELQEVSARIQSEKEYQDILAALDVMREKMDANYIYIADQTDGEGNVISTLTYLFDAENPDDEFPAFVPGDTGKMNEKFLNDSSTFTKRETAATTTSIPTVISVTIHLLLPPSRTAMGK